jgi:GT2 family glycosyltransferase
VAVSSRTATARRVFQAAAGELDRGDWTPWDIGSGGNMLVRQATLATIGGSDPRLGPGTPNRAAEDIDLLYRLARAGTLGYTPAAVVYHAGKSRAARLRRRYAYGRGMGALLAKHWRAGDPAAARLVAFYLRHQGATAWRGGRWGLPESLLTLAGFGRSFLPLLPLLLAQAGAGKVSS